MAFIVCFVAMATAYYHGKFYPKLMAFILCFIAINFYQIQLVSESVFHLKPSENCPLHQITFHTETMSGIRTLGNSFNDYSITDRDAGKVWDKLETQRKQLNYIDLLQHSPSECMLIYNVAAQTCATFDHALYAIDTLVSTVAGFHRVELSVNRQKYSQPNGLYALDVRFPNKLKTPLIQWMDAALRHLDRLNTQYQACADNTPIKIAIYGKDEAKTIVNYDPSLHGSYVSSANNFSALGTEYNTTISVHSANNFSAKRQCIAG
eukprot:910881_1